MKSILIKLINLYQSTPIKTHNNCRFTPTCSQYMKEALIMHGTFKGLKLGINRIFRCHPFGKHGYDPVREKL